MEYALWAIVVVTIVLQYIYKIIITKKQRKQFETESIKRNDYLKTLKVNDEIVTVYGMYGIINDIDDTVVMLKVAKDCIIKIEIESILIKTA